MKRTYSELSQLETFTERYDYLRLDGQVGRQTFGHERWLNQRFYSSHEWKRIRDRVIARDLGLDLGVPGHDVYKTIQVHHMNPMRPGDFNEFNEEVLDPEFLITISLRTHNAVHYGGDAPGGQYRLPERGPGDTTPW